MPPLLLHPAIIVIGHTCRGLIHDRVALMRLKVWHHFLGQPPKSYDIV